MPPLLCLLRLLSGTDWRRMSRPEFLRDGVDAALSPTASQCAKLVMLKSQTKGEGTHEESHLPRLGAVLEDPHSALPPLTREICRELLDQMVHLTGRISAMKKRIDAIAREGGTSRRLQTMPGVGPISALAVEPFAPPMEQFKRGRDFAAWLPDPAARFEPDHQVVRKT